MMGLGGAARRLRCRPRRRYIVADLLVVTLQSSRCGHAIVLSRRALVVTFLSSSRCRRHVIVDIFVVVILVFQVVVALLSFSAFSSSSFS